MGAEGGWRLLAAERLHDILRDERATQRTLRWYERFSRVAVFLGIVVPILASSTVVSSLSEKHSDWPFWTGLLTVVAAVLLALHKGLNCDSFHAKARATLTQMRGLAMAYERLLSNPDVEAAAMPAPFELLEDRLVQLYDKFADVLPMRPTKVVWPAADTLSEPASSGGRIPSFV